MNDKNKKLSVLGWIVYLSLAILCSRGIIYFYKSIDVHSMWFSFIEYSFLFWILLLLVIEMFIHFLDEEFFDNWSIKNHDIFIIFYITTTFITFNTVSKLIPNDVILLNKENYSLVILFNIVYITSGLVHLLHIIVSRRDVLFDNKISNFIKKIDYYLTADSNKTKIKNKNQIDLKKERKI